MESLMVRIHIDGREYHVKSGKNLLDTCLALGLNVPHFCYHGALGSVGACRLCAVKKYKDASDMNGRIIMSCMEPVTDGLIISVEDPEARSFRASIIEGLMINHPHDCPVCDEGGECHLQDMTVMTGHNYRRFDFKKRTYNNQYLGPFINHEMNRCIQCYRCVRFYKDYAGGNDLDVFSAHDNVYFGRHEEGILESEFSGNLIEVCPTGVFTDKTLKGHYTRKWDMTNAPSLCVHCSVGCNTIAGERYGSLRRIMSRYNGSVNGYFICDRGRFGYEFVNSEQRIRKIQIRSSKDKNLEQAFDGHSTSALSSALSGNKKIIGIGSPRASLEANFALSVLAGQGNFYHGISEKEHNLVKTVIDILQNRPVHSPSLKEIEKADAVFILGEDLTNTAPMMALAVRQAARNKAVEEAMKAGIPQWNDFAQREKAQDLKSPIFIATSYSTKIDDLAEDKFNASPADIAELGFAVASFVNGSAPDIKSLDDEQQKLARKIASLLKESKNPLIISGTQSNSIEILHAAANIAGALSSSGKNASLSLVVPECNSMGLGLMEGKSLDHAYASVNQDDVDTLIILENDLYRRADKEKVDILFSKCKNVIVLDSLVNATTLKADILLPVGTFAESEGTIVNNEGRAQRYYSVFSQDKSVIESWRQLIDLIEVSGKKEKESWKYFEDVVSAMTEALPVFSKINSHRHDPDFRMLNEKIKRQTIRFSGRTAMNANIAVSEPKPPLDPDSSLAFSMEGTDEQPPSSMVPYYWSPGWNSVQALNFYLDEPNGSMKGGDPGIRLIENDGKSKTSFFTPGEKDVNAAKGELLIVPVYRIFGSDELSSKAPAVNERIEQPFLLLNEKDAEKNKIKDKDLVKIMLAEITLEVKIKLDQSLPDGVAALSAHLPGMPFIELPGSGKIIL